MMLEQGPAGSPPASPPVPVARFHHTVGVRDEQITRRERRDGILPTMIGEYAEQNTGVGAPLPSRLTAPARR